jgi:hypothetical protein
MSSGKAPRVGGKVVIGIAMSLVVMAVTVEQLVIPPPDSQSCIDPLFAFFTKAHPEAAWFALPEHL